MTAADPPADAVRAVDAMDTDTTDTMDTMDTMGAVSAAGAAGPAGSGLGGLALAGEAGLQALARFHPAVAEWFRRRFPDGPTEAQALGWASIGRGEDTLVAAPTGSGKTLAAFLVAIDACLRRPFEGDARAGTSVLYVSPLRALTVDVAENLERPLAEIRQIAAELGAELPEVRVAVRNGDTPAHARAAMLRERPEIVVTTPESLYLLVTAARGRQLLAGVEAVIVDEIHALARDKRGSHLALTLERLDACVQAAGGRRPTRIGLSATQRPIETVARLLVGAGPQRSDPEGRPRCAVVDVGHRRPIEVAIELPGDELGAVSTTDQLHEVVARIGEHVKAHRTTLIFVNTRRMAERLAHLLGDVLGEELVAAHHGSLSTERRLRVESRLRAGELRGVVATASLELGIDVGPVDLVCQLGSPRSIATFLQRVGRAEHRLGGVPKGRLYPLTRDELVECLALLAAVGQGRLDAVEPPLAPLDILAQQVVAECAAAGEDGLDESELLALVRRAAPYASLGEDDFEQVVELVSEGVTTGRGRRGAHLHRDRVNGRLRPRRGARLVAATSGGAIPELADYRVVVEPDEALVGTVHEDFAVEAMAGDVFLLGTHSWRVKRVETGVVRVVDAEGAAPTLPFWLGEAPARTDELADAVSELRELVEARLVAGGPPAARRALEAFSGVTGRPVEEAVAYLATAWTQLGALPTKHRVVLERFFDDTGGMQLVVHAPFGGRVNRGLGLALRKRFCRTFDFELQAAAGDDAAVLSLGPQHAFPLEEVGRYLAPDTVGEVLVQAVLPTPIFTSRWRWNLSRSLVAPRFRGGRHLPPAIQRMEADDLMAAIFPSLAACQENVTGPIEPPDHPIVRQAIADCCTEAMDLDGLRQLVGGLRSGEVALHCVDTAEPSVLSHEILNGRPYTFLDDAPLEERRTRAVATRRGLPLEAHDLSALDPEIVAEVAAEAAPAPRDAEELHELLSSCLVLAPRPELVPLFDALVAAGRAGTLRTDEGLIRWCAAERRRELAALYPAAAVEPEPKLPPSLSAGTAPSPEEALASAVRGHLECSGPVTPSELAEQIGGVGVGAVELALLAVEGKGGALRVLGDRWCARRLVARIHARMRDRDRRSFSPVSAQDLMRFLLDWQHVAPGTRLVGSGGLLEVLDQLQGCELPVGAWEEAVLPARLAGYTPRLLDEACANGELAWGRLSARSPEQDGTVRRSGATPSRATPVALLRRGDLDGLLTAARGEARPAEPGPGAASDVLDALRSRGALFFPDLCRLTGRLPVEVAEALWDGVARGLLTADGFAAVRALLAGRYRTTSSRPGMRRPLRRLSAAGSVAAGSGAGAAGAGGAGATGAGAVAGRGAAIAAGVPPALAGGRWSLLAEGQSPQFDPDELAEAFAGQLLARWGVVFRDLVARELGALAWRDVLWALRRFEARGVVRGGRFVGGLTGEQFALPEALDRLRKVASAPLSGTVVRLSAADPLNLTGIVLPGPRVPAVRGRELVLLDGLPAALAALAGATAVPSAS